MVPATLKVMVSSPAPAGQSPAGASVLAAVIASRRVQAPSTATSPSANDVTTMPAPSTELAENVVTSPKDEQRGKGEAN